MNKTRKHRFNGFDVAIILVILVLIFGIYYKFRVINKSPNASVTELDSIKYQVTIKNLRQPSVDAVELDSMLYDSKSGISIGKVVDKKVNPSEGLILLETGEYITETKPNRYDLLVTLEVPGVEKENGYFINGKLELKRQSDMTINSKKFEAACTVYDILELK